MNANAQVVQGVPRKPRVRLWFLLVVLGVAAFIGWLVWPSPSSGVSVLELSRADGKPRFEVTRYSKANLSGLNFAQRLYFEWFEYRRHTKPNPMASTFPPGPVQPCSIQGLLNQCMETCGTKYLMAVEVLGGSVNFGHTNTLNGVQWVSAFEHALTNQPVWCYDYTKKHGFSDTLLFIREGPNLVKIVPRTKLSVYENADLVKADRAGDAGR